MQVPMRSWNKENSSLCSMMPFLLFKETRGCFQAFIWPSDALFGDGAIERDIQFGLSRVINRMLLHFLSNHPSKGA